MKEFKKLVFVFGLLFLFGSCLQKQNKNIVLLKDFIRVVSNQKMTPTEILPKYLCDKINGSQLSQSNKNKNFIKNQIIALSNKLESTDLNTLSYKPYKNLPQDEQNILIADSLKENIYIILKNDERFLDVIFENRGGKIRSFTTMNKGDHKVFIFYCK